MQPAEEVVTSSLCKVILNLSIAMKCLRQLPPSKVGIPLLLECFCLFL